MNIYATHTNAQLKGYLDITTTQYDPFNAFAERRDYNEFARISRQESVSIRYYHALRLEFGLVKKSSCCQSRPTSRRKKQARKYRVSIKNGDTVVNAFLLCVKRSTAYSSRVSCYET